MSVFAKKHAQVWISMILVLLISHVSTVFAASTQHTAETAFLTSHFVQTHNHHPVAHLMQSGQCTNEPLSSAVIDSTIENLPHIALQHQCSNQQEQHSICQDCQQWHCHLLMLSFLTEQHNLLGKSDVFDITILNAPYTQYPIKQIVPPLFRPPRG